MANRIAELLETLCLQAGLEAFNEVVEQQAVEVDGTLVTMDDSADGLQVAITAFLEAPPTDLVPREALLVSLLQQGFEDRADPDALHWSLPQDGDQVAATVFVPMSEIEFADDLLGAARAVVEWAAEELEETLAPVVAAQLAPGALAAADARGLAAKREVAFV